VVHSVFSFLRTQDVVLSQRVCKLWNNRRMLNVEKVHIPNQKALDWVLKQNLIGVHWVVASSVSTSSKPFFKKVENVVTACFISHYLQDLSETKFHRLQSFFTSTSLSNECLEVLKTAQKSLILLQTNSHANPHTHLREIKEFSALRYLKCGVYEDQINNICQATWLVHVSLRVDTVRDLTPMSNMCNLESLELRGLRSSVKPIVFLPKLEYLHLNFIWYISDLSQSLMLAKNRGFQTLNALRISGVLSDDERFEIVRTLGEFSALEAFYGVCDQTARCHKLSTVGLTIGGHHFDADLMTSTLNSLTNVKTLYLNSTQSTHEVQNFINKLTIPNIQIIDPESFHYHQAHSHFLKNLS
jgi:hypothetical protein